MHTKEDKPLAKLLIYIKNNNAPRIEPWENPTLKTNMLTNTPLIFLNLENRNILIVLHSNIPKLNDKKNINKVDKMLQENDIAPKTISISLRMLIAVSETN